MAAGRLWNVQPQYLTLRRRALRGVSKGETEPLVCGSSFETRPAAAPQDEGVR
jgi:hypothetical protein